MSDNGDEDIASQVQTVSWSGLDGESRKRFLWAYRAFALAWPDAAHLPIGFFLLPRSGDLCGVWSFPGEGMNLYREIWLRAVNEKRLPPEHVILRGLIRCARCCHLGCGIDDHQASQLRQADRDLVRLASAVSDSTDRPPILCAPRFIPRIHLVG